MTLERPPSQRGPAAPFLPFESGRFVLIEEIGRGGVGSVYRARDTGFAVPRSVCIKRLNHTRSAEPAQALREEARLLAAVRHANVVTLLGMGEESGGPFLVLELIDGLNLYALSRALARLDEPATSSTDGEGRSRWPEPLAVHVACAILRGLGALSRALPDFVHRDITPHNVLISNEGEIKLTDFGVALTRDQGPADPKHVRGKVGYMAPEQIEGLTLDRRTDLYAVGVLLYELLAGKRPGQVANRSVEELRRTVRGDIEPIAVHRPHLHTDLQRILSQLLALRPADRFRTADAALRALAPHGAGEIGSLRMTALVDAAVTPTRRGARATTSKM